MLRPLTVTRNVRVPHRVCEHRRAEADRACVPATTLCGVDVAVDVAAGPAAPCCWPAALFTVVTGWLLVSQAGFPATPHAGTWLVSQAGLPATPQTGTWFSSHAGLPATPQTGTWFSSHAGLPATPQTGAWFSSHAGLPATPQTGGGTHWASSPSFSALALWPLPLWALSC